MPYHVRVFCTGSSVPTLAQLLVHAKVYGVDLTTDESCGVADLDTQNWTQAEFHYKPGKGPLIVECNRDDGTGRCLAKIEPHEFIEMIEDAGLASEGRRVIEHLKATKFIVMSQLLSDIDDDGFEANTIFLEYFVDHCGGLIHADCEGFYEDGVLILEVG